MSAHTSLHMSPAQAAQVACVSRWTIMRAIKAQALLAFRDNRNQWQIKNSDLTAWLSAQGIRTVRENSNAHHQHTIAHPEPIHPDTLELIRIKAELEAEKILRTTIESDRDRWREIAQQLAESRPRKWWFGR